MPQLPREVVKARSAQLRKVAEARRSRWLDSFVGSTQQVLLEGNGTAHTDNFAPVSISNGRCGESGLARIIGRSGNKLTAVWA